VTQPAPVDTHTAPGGHGDPAAALPGLVGLVPAPSGNIRPAQRWTTVMDGQRMRQLRRQHGLSQEKLADLAGLSITTVARLERQRYAPCRTYTLARLAAVLGELPAATSPSHSTPALGTPP
jgi:DNA-binding XRE family transcriptional regulator